MAFGSMLLEEMMVSTYIEAILRAEMSMMERPKDFDLNIVVRTQETRSKKARSSDIDRIFPGREIPSMPPNTWQETHPHMDIGSWELTSKMPKAGKDVPEITASRRVIRSMSYLEFDTENVRRKKGD